MNGAQTIPIIELRRVSLLLGGTPILSNIDLHIGRGEFVCVVGHSGCGKTSLLRMIAGLVKPTSGQIRYEAAEIHAPKRDIAILFQDYTRALLPWRTVYGNVALALEANETPPTERRAIIEQLLERVGLAPHADKYPVQLSGGMQQRVQIARCLAQRPTVLLMDEPFGALDAMTRQALQDEIQELVAATGMTVCFVTHDLEEALYLGDRVIGLRSHPGRIAEDMAVSMACPRDQRTTPEDPEFLRLRRRLFDFIQSSD